jgi:hypothetical protein
MSMRLLERKERVSRNGDVVVNLFIKSFPDRLVREIHAKGLANGCRNFKQSLVYVIREGMKDWYSAGNGGM